MASACRTRALELAGAADFLMLQHRTDSLAVRHLSNLWPVRRAAAEARAPEGGGGGAGGMMAVQEGARRRSRIAGGAVHETLVTEPETLARSKAIVKISGAAAGQGNFAIK